MDLKDLLKIMIEKGGSDLFITTGAPPSMKAHGKLLPMTDKILPPGNCLFHDERRTNR